MSKVAGRDKREKNTKEKGLKKTCTQRVCEIMGENSTESYERELRTIEIQ